MDPQGFAVARKQSWYPWWKMSSSFIVSNDDGFYILSVESKLWKKLDCANLCTCVYLLQPLIRSRKQWGTSNKPHCFPYTPQDFFSFCGFFYPLNYSDAVTQISSWEHSTQKTFPGPGVMAVRQMPLRPGTMLSQAGRENTRDLGSPLCSLQLQHPPNRRFFVYLAFVDHSLIAA